MVGGGRLWRTRHNLAAAGLTVEQWRDTWDATRMFLTADGESGKPMSNGTIRVAPDGRTSVSIPTALVAELGARLELAAPVSLDVHRGGEWVDRIVARQAVRYDIWHDPAKDRILGC